MLLATVVLLGLTMLPSFRTREEAFQDEEA
jgi:hypothetical protein